MGCVESKTEDETTELAGVGELQAGSKMAVQIPEGAIEGSDITFKAPDGRKIQVTVPEGYGPGDKIWVEIPATAPKKEKRFGTLLQAFQYMDPKNTGYITDHHLFAEVAEDIADLKGTADEVWQSLDQDGNGQVNWPEFVEWAEAKNVQMELGMGDDSKGGIAFPALWKGPRDDPNWVQQYDVTDNDHFLALDELVHKTYKKVWTRDRKKTGSDKVPSSFELVKAKRCENLKDWKRYYYRRHQIAHACSNKETFLKRPVLTSQARELVKLQKVRGYCNEWLLFHGTSPEAAKSILSGSGDFTISLAGSATGTLYGRGTYFAESITKADEYAKADEDGLCCVLVCKIAAGCVLYNDEVEPDADKLQSQCISGEYHSILGDREKCRKTFKEFVIFDADQVYVEYALFYRRKYS
mmetsp:Transcript_49931/g.116580  ORF Transcript_49931/g.116580 Transcript_49931/m.116580 type:complete len:411 (-) Transcript_49931:271-1503(-)